MRNVVATPIEAPEPFIGEWSVEARHVAFPDTRGVHRVYDTTFGRGVSTLARTAVSATDFDQRLNARFSAGRRP